MKQKGIRIEDVEGGVLSVSLADILSIVDDGERYKWIILYSDVVLRPGCEDSAVQLKERINEAEQGLGIGWQDLIKFAGNIHQEIDFCVIGVKDVAKVQNIVHQYPDWKQIYKNCDVVIEMTDTSYWEVYAKELDLLKRCHDTFKKTQWIEAI